MADIIIPAKNESHITIVLDQLAQLKTRIDSVYIIVDSVDDETLNFIKPTKNLNVELVVNSNQKNFFGAVLKGLQTSRAELVAVVMADGCDSLSDLDKMFELADERKMCIVCGERTNQNTESFFKSAMRFVLRSLFKYGLRLPFSDLTNNFKVYRRKSVLELIDQDTKGFSWSFEVTVKALLKKEKVGFVSTKARNRQTGKSNFSISFELRGYVKWLLIYLSARG